MKILITLAWRNLWRKKRRTLITVSSVVFAVILAIGLISLIDGTRDQMVESIIKNTTGHIQVQDALYDDEPSIDHSLEYGPEVKEALDRYSDRFEYTVPRIHGFCLGAKDMGTRGVFLMGVDPGKEDRMNDLSSRIIEGKMFSTDDDFAVIAEGVARLLELSTGDTIVLLGQGFQGMTAAGTYPVGGIVEFPLPDQNNTMVYLPLPEAQDFFAAPGRLTSLILMLEDEDQATALASDLNAGLDDDWYAVKTWEELMPDAVAAFEARDAQVQIFAWILYIVAGFGIFGTVITMMHERLREFGILLSVGLRRSQLATVCMMETVIMSFIGVIAGVAIGYPIVYWFHQNPIRLSDELADVMLDMGLEPVMPFSVSGDIFLYQAVVIFIIAVVVGLYPARKVFKLNMVSAART
jgi:putative ABC transport system permease protein